MSHPRIDWRTVFMLLPRRRFSDDELRLARAAELSPTTKVAAALNLALPVATFLAFEGPRNPLPFSLVMVLFALGLLGAGVAAWRNPGSRGARLGYWVLPLSAGAAGGWMLQSGAYQRVSMAVLGLTVGLGALSLWVAIVHRHQFIVMRLQEAQERDKAIEMAQRLHGAQLEPHFLFNTLASVQHWVQTQDPRAAPLLDALTGYLRATLPLFKQPLVQAADELLAVQRYLQVMQARLGERLAWRMEVEPAVYAWRLPPGVLLTLVENAILHGIEPRLADGELVLRGWRQGDTLVFEVLDNGPGPRLDAGGGPAEGVGLSNIRQRLALACGPTARLSLQTAPGGGCLARVELPVMESPEP